MSNFVLLGTPNFVIVAATGNCPLPRKGVGLLFLNPLFDEIAGEPGTRMDDSCESDSVRFAGRARPMIETVLRQYGFERRPRTLGELWGLFGYCDRLDVITGTGVFEAGMLAQWQQLTFDLSGGRKGMPHQPAVELYRRGNSAGLLAWHIEHRVLAELGKCYQPVPGSQPYASPGQS